MTILLVLLEDVVSHKNIRNTIYQKLCVYYTYLYNISRDFSSSHHLELKCMGGLFFFSAIPTQRVLPYSLMNACISRTLISHS